MRRLTPALLLAAAAACLVGAFAGHAAAQDPPPTPPPNPPGYDDEDGPASPGATAPTPAAATGGPGLIPIPAGCPVPPQARVVFVGRLVARDTRTGRFEIEVVRAGSAEGFTSGNLVDVLYGIDAKFLSVGNQYLVGAGVDDGVLASKVRPEEPLFGGDEVVGAAEVDVECPTIEDPIRTLTVTGRSIDSGVLQPLSSKRGTLLRAIVVPIGVAFAILLGLAAVRWLLTGVARGASSAANLSRSRRYHSGQPQ